MNAELPLYVVDSSVAVKWFAEEPYHRRAKRLLRQYINQKVDFAVPAHFPYEVVSGLWNKARTGEWSEEKSIRRIGIAIERLRDLSVPTFFSWDLFSEAVGIAQDYRLKMNDAIFVALALALDCELITVDEESLYNRVKDDLP